MQTQKVTEHIINWLKNYAETAKMNGFVIGISGGIDSAVVSTLAAKTGLKTLVIELPIRQKKDQVQRAQEQISFLKNNFENVESLEIDLTETFDVFEKNVISKSSTTQNRELSLANSRSRLRMLTLYYFGQIHNLLVTGTGNKIEDFGIPESIQKAAPTDGLWDTERTDEQQIGATYPELEWAMSVHQDHSVEDFSGREKEVFMIYDRLNRATQHKINPIPVCKIPKELF